MLSVQCPTCLRLVEFDGASSHHCERRRWVCEHDEGVGGRRLCEACFQARKSKLTESPR